MRKNILVIGGGGREHAICCKLLASQKVDKVYFAPGNAATEKDLLVVNLDPKNHLDVVNFIKASDIYYCVVGPEAPLADGLIDTLEQHGVACFGPSKAAAQLESSKTYAKEVMNSADVPTAVAEYFSTEAEALSYLDKVKAPVVIKADGLAAGKGVTVAMDLETARAAIIDCFSGNMFGSAGSLVLIEDYLEGREASVMAIINSGNICMLPVSSDYKRALDNNEGPNTGGMGAISPTPIFSEDRLEEVKSKVFIPVINELKNRGIDYKGFLYAGLMVSPNGTFKVLEFNCRLGDPETQSLLLRINDDFFELIETAIFNPQNLPPVVDLNPNTALTVVLASKGYPGDVDDNKEVTGLELCLEGCKVFHAGTKLVDNKVYTKGGRIFGVSGIYEDYNTAKESIYSVVDQVNFSGKQYRTDIGKF